MQHPHAIKKHAPRSQSVCLVSQMPGVARIGVGLQEKGGYVTVNYVLPDSPAARYVAKGEVVIAVNGVLVGADAQGAQQAIVAALQPRMTGEYVPVRLTIGRLELPSPKGIESDFSLEFGQQLSEKLQATRNGGTWSVGAPAMASPKREVVQIM